MAKKYSKESIVYENNKLIDALTPMGLEFRRSDIQFGDMLSEVMVITKYPSVLGTAWLSKITKISGVTLNIHAEPTSPTLLMTELEEQMKTISMKLTGSNINELTRRRLETEQKDILNLREVIEDKNEKVVLMTITVFLRAIDKDTLESLKTRVKNIASGNGLKVRTISFRQQESLKTVSPYFQHQKSILNLGEQIMPMSTASASFPFNNSGVNHGKGVLLGKDAGGGILLIDLWKRGGDITNSNLTLLGVSGVGKSATIKEILMQEYAQGTKIIILDPEREYKEMCMNVHGSWINIGSGDVGGRINPFQVKSIPLDDDDDDDDDDDEISFGSDITNLVRLHFQFLRSFYRLYFRMLSESEIALLEEVTEIMYANFDITYDTNISTKSPKDFPVMEDLYNTAIKESENDDLSDSMKERYENIILAIRAGAIGADSNLWNGITTLESTDDFIVLDTYDLQNSDINLKRTQYFNACTWIWEQVSANRDEKIIMVVDEAYLMADPEVPQTLMFLRDVEKRIRKYNGGLFVISHSVVDFLHENIKQYGQALLDMPSFKFFMGTDGKDLQEAVNIMQFTDKEADILSKKQRGHAIAYIGSKKVHAIVHIEQWELDMFGSAGGK